MLVFFNIPLKIFFYFFLFFFLHFGVIRRN